MDMKTAGYLVESMDCMMVQHLVGLKEYWMGES